MKNKEMMDNRDSNVQKKQSEIEKLKGDYSEYKNHGVNRKLRELNDLNNILEKLTPEQQKKQEGLSLDIAMAYGLENGLWISNLTHQKYHQSLGQIRNKIVKDFDCKTSLELMLADRITANYWRCMRNDTLLNYYMEDENGAFSYSQLKINIIKEFNRGIERADRQLNADIILLKELKQPRLNIKVTTENAFIAQNQQVNVDKKNNEIK